ncbi:MAG TPA: hypothetical protein VEU77_06775 [Candidatus Acidoferrales bacterium]|nr:hypothetical protein [Candidatus Acidoferrales bacterium]
MTYAETLSGWHDFFVTCGAASATLVGLLYVGISLHVKIVATHRDVRGLARVTLSTYFTVVIVSLLMLVPTDRPSFTAEWLLVASLVALVAVVPASLDALAGRRRLALPRRVVFSRFGVATVTFAGLTAFAVVMLNGDYTDALYAIVGILLLMLLVSIRNTWDLLVTVAAK